MNAPLSGINLQWQVAAPERGELRAVENFLRDAAHEVRDHRIETARTRCKRKAQRQYHVGDQQGFIHSCYRIQRLNRMRRPEVVEQMDSDRLERCKRRSV